MRYTLDLPPETASVVDEAVRSGDFPNATAVVVAALTVLKAGRGVEHLLGYSMDELRRLGDEGEASGTGREIGIEEIKRDGFRRAGVPYPAE